MFIKANKTMFSLIHLLSKVGRLIVGRYPYSYIPMCPIYRKKKTRDWSHILYPLCIPLLYLLASCSSGDGGTGGTGSSDEVISPKVPEALNTTSVRSLSFIPQESEVTVGWESVIASLREQLEDDEEIEQVIISWRTSFDSNLLAQFNQESRNSLSTRRLPVGGIGGDQVNQEESDPSRHSPRDIGGDQVNQEGNEGLLRNRHQVVDLDRDGFAFTGEPSGDNCPGDSNPNQADDDNDGYGDVCDPAPNNPLLLIPANRSVVIKWQDSQASQVESWTIRFIDINQQDVTISPDYTFSHNGGSELSAKLNHGDIIGGQTVVLANDKPYRFSVSVVFTDGTMQSLYDFTDPPVILGSNYDGDLIRDLEDEDDDNDGMMDVEEAEPEYILQSAIAGSIEVAGNVTENILGGFANNSEYDFSVEVLIVRGAFRERRNLANGTILLGPNPDNDGLANQDDEDDDNDLLPDSQDIGMVNGRECRLHKDCDRDGLNDNDAEEQQNNSAGESCFLLADCDGDNAIDSLDAFVLDANETEDTDRDGIGNNKDDDIDGDNIANEEDEDQDNDNLKDIFEVVGCDRLVDCDSDGLRDGDEPLACMIVADCDNDTILDGAEVPGCVQSADCDGDTIEDGLEVAQECIISVDCDKDGVEDWAEPARECVLMPDCDHDGLGDSEELGLFYQGLWCGLARDCDKDSLRDYDELSYDRSCINSRDCDGDNISDSVEILGCIFAADCDQDGVSDNDEIERRCILDSDCDGDGIADGDEPSIFCSISRDCDKDFLSDSEERLLFNSDGDSCMLLPDCDGDTIFDFDEIFNCVTTVDCDGDRVWDNDEVRRECILNEDCDGDGLDDRVDFCPLMPGGQDDEDGCPDDIDRPDPPDLSDGAGATRVLDEIVLQFRPEPTRVNLDWVNPHPSETIGKIDISYGEVGEIDQRQLSLIGVMGIFNQYFSIAVPGLQDNTHYNFTIDIIYTAGFGLSASGSIWTGLNSDGDGLRDEDDEDDDNNGILDEDEEATTSCIRVDDCDGDGVLNTVENNLLNASSGISCSMLEDCDGDLVVDGEEAALQCFVKPDCDNDRFTDNNDAFPLNPAEWRDDDNDGIGNNTDNCVSVANPDQINTDGAEDGGDACDPDDDNDGFGDTNDAFPLDPAEWRDDDSDGIGNNRDNCVSVANPDQRNTDNDLNGGDACDEDDDNDGFVDSLDAFPLDGTEWEDTDNDKKGNNADPDDDNDDLLDTDPRERLTNVTSGISCSLLIDCDGDGEPDVKDAFPTNPQETADSDGDGIGDNSDNCPLVANPDQINTDGDDDGGDACDNDDDNDGHLDGSDNCPLQYNPDQTVNVCEGDSDSDGVLNHQDNCPMHANPDQNNTDGDDDGGDVCDSDDDNDNYVDIRDNCQFVANPDQINTDGADDGGDACDEDDDNDEVLDNRDNCPLVANPDQINSDRDGDGGDACDEDDDNDQIIDRRDNCPLVANPDQINTDGTDDGGDACDRDDDNDGDPDDSDNCPLIANPDQINTDGTADGGDACDEDDDNDGVFDGRDNCPLVANPNQINTDGTADGGDACDVDDDNDGVFDGRDNCPLVANPNQINTDGTADGGDACDEDDDNDGVADGEDAFPTDPTESKDTDKDGVGDIYDVDVDGDGLIEVGRVAELDAVRYALNGRGRKLSASAELNTTGCGGMGRIHSCSGYELVANISLAAYSDGKGWQPLGHDTDSSSFGCQGAAFDGIFEGNGRTISNLSISRSDEDCVGLFGRIAKDSEIRNLRLSAEAVIGGLVVGGLVGWGESARIVSSSVVVDEVKGGVIVGGLVGWGHRARIHYSLVEAAEVRGTGDYVGGLVGDGWESRIHSSSVVVDEVSGTSGVGGLVGWGESARIHSSSVVAAEVRGTGDNAGGLVGWGQGARIRSSSIVVGEMSGSAAVGGLAGYFQNGRVAYSYVVSGSSNTAMLVGEGSGATGVASYWDSETSGINSGNHGEARTGDELRRPTDYEEIYASWDDDPNIFDDGDESLAVWCDKDNSGDIEVHERTNDNLVWDFGTSNEYPAIRCTPIAPAEWRSWWSLDETGKPQLDQTRLGELFPSFSSPGSFEVNLTFAPISGGFRIGNQSAFGNLVSLTITATSKSEVEELNINIAEFIDGSYDFIGLDDQSDWTFRIIGILRDGRQQDVEITFVWQENDEDHTSGGIRSGLDTDGDRRADSVDEDDDNDRVGDSSDQCSTGETGWTSNASTDNDGDGCRDGGEDTDDDNDLVADSSDQCSTGETGWTSNASTDNDRDGCRDESEDPDDDNDLVADSSDQCSTGETGWTSNSSTDNDRDGCRDESEDPDDDNDLVADSSDQCSTGETGWTSNSSTDNDGDGCRDESEDADDDNDLVADISDQCSTGETDWLSNGSTDNDGDGCRDESEDPDDDNDLVADISDQCRAGETGWTSNSSTDNDGDGCRDAGEDTDDDNDLVDDNSDQCSTGETGWTSNTSTDNDRDGCQDASEDIDDDNDLVDDNSDQCRAGETGWTSNTSTDNDRDGCQDASEDIDDDGDGLIEIATAEELDVVRYALDGGGRRLSDTAALNTTGCGGDGGITSCSGYELVADISLAAYSGGKGWRPLGNDTSSEAGCQGDAFAGTFEGNGWTISDLSIDRSGEDCVGLFGHIAEDSEIRNLTLHAERVIGNRRVGGLVGGGRSARIISSSVVVGEVRGTYGYVGGLVGDGGGARIYASSVVAGKVSGHGSIGGLMGDGSSARIVSSSVVANEVSGTSSRVGGLVGWGKESARIFSSSVVLGESSSVSGLVGFGPSARIAYSYVVSGSNDGFGSGTGVASYWDSDVSGVSSGNNGDPKTTSELRSPTGYEGIYAAWDDETDIFGEGDEPLAVWCDKDNSGNIEADERTDDNRVWDFGTSSEYPAIRCTPISPAEWRSWWFLNETGKPELDQTRLDMLLPFFEVNLTFAPIRVDFTFAPISGGFRIGVQSDFGDIVSLNITATNGSRVEERNINIAEFIDGSYDFTGLDDQFDWAFRIIGTLSDGKERMVRIVFVWGENRLDHGNNGIRPGINTDGDGRADSVDDDDDNDNVLDLMDTGMIDGRDCRLHKDCDTDGVGDSSDQCRAGETGWTSNVSTDNDGDGCRDESEDTDDDNDGLADTDEREQQIGLGGKSCSLLVDCDNDGVGDSSDQCSAGATGWISDGSTDNDGDGCRDADEDTDDDNDGLNDTDVREQQISLGGESCSLLADCDGDTVRDIDEVAANCVIRADCDNDGIRDDDEAAGCVLDSDCDDDGIGDNEGDACPAGETSWVSGVSTDNDGDGCRDAGEDIDDDGDGLIEIARAAELDAVRYALNGSGRRLSENAELDTTGCGGDGGITSCFGYELVADISLAAYSDGKGWQPLGNDTDSSNFGCQGVAFDGIFEGNSWTIGDLSINRSSEDCVGLFGHIAEDSEIRNLTIRAERVTGKNSVGGLVGWGDSAQIFSSSVVAGEVSGSGARVGGLVGRGDLARIISSSVEADEVSGTNIIGGLVGRGGGVSIHSSSVMAGEVSGGARVGGLVGWGDWAYIVSSSAVAGEVSGGARVGGLVGEGDDARIHSSSVVANEVSGDGPVGGLVGEGDDARIVSSSVVANEVRGTYTYGYVGGLVGRGWHSRIHSSSVVVGEVSGTGDRVGGLVGYFGSGRVAYSYVVSGSNTAMLVGAGSGTGVASYWDSETSGRDSGNHGEAKTGDELRSPTGYEGIYAAWDDETGIFGDGNNEPLAVWCDKDNSGIIEASERTDDNRIWDFGTSSQYPSIRCTPISPAKWRGWWFLNGDGKPQLDQTRLDRMLPSFEDDDNDGVGNDSDQCPAGETGWISDPSTDNDGDGCQDASEDTDDDNDLVADNSDDCPTGETGWTSNTSTDNDGDGCRDTDEDIDDDNDLVADSSDQCSTGETGWTSNTSNDNDRDGCRDADEDIDDDGDGLIEIATAAELDAVRYALNGRGRRLLEGAVLDTTGCGGEGGITSCSGYELVADISLAAYSDGKGWQPLGNDTSSEAGCQGAAFAGTFEGNGWTISDLNISRPDEDCVGLFGNIAEDSEIRNLTLHAETVIGNRRVGGLVGGGRSARIISSSVVANEVRGTYGYVGGLVGDGFGSQLVSSSVVADKVSGTGSIGGLVGDGSSARIFSSSVVADEVSGASRVGGLVGWGWASRIHSSSVVAGEVRGSSNVGGLVGYGTDRNTKIISCSIVVGEVSGRSSVGGLVGRGGWAQIYSSSVVVGEVDGGYAVGGLVGSGDDAWIAYSYVVSSSNIAMLVEIGSGTGVASYWDSETSGVNSGNHGEGKTSDELRSPTDYEGIYAAWDDDTDIFGDGEDVPLAVWCDKDNSGNITADERTDDNRIWDFGTASQYPAIRCTPITPTEWRSWWFLNGTGKPQLDQTRLGDILLYSFEIDLTFAPISGGFRIGNQSDFGNFVSLNITATNGSGVEERTINIAEFIDGSYDFIGLDDQSDWTFQITGALSDGREREVEIVFVWGENEEDHQSGGIRPGLDTDGDGRADSVDEDDDNDNILDLMDTGMVDGRECRLHEDCDSDGVADNSDQCRVGETGWTSNGSTDNDGDGCQDASEDTDDDNDGLDDTDVREQQTNSNDVSCSLLADCDGDTVRDIDEVAAHCVLEADCDGDTVIDGADIDDDGDGLIEIATAVELDAVRYALNGRGRRLLEGAVLDTTGCGGEGGITSCSGYELIANISLAAYSDGKGWRPLGHDTSSEAGCQGAAFAGTFEGNGWTISGLNISRSDEDCVGLFGHIAEDSEIRNLTIRAETVIGEDSVGGLVGQGNSARIISSSVVADEVRGSGARVGGLVGWGDSARIVSSSVVADEVHGRGTTVGGLVGRGSNIRIISSSVVVGKLSGTSNRRNGLVEIGGLVGQGHSAWIVSSSVVVGKLSGTSSWIGGLVGSGYRSQVHSSSVVVGEVSGDGDDVGGLVGYFNSGRVAYSYVVSGSTTPMLVGSSGGTGVASYWDSETSGVNSGSTGDPKTTNELRSPTGYEGIYAAWDDETDIFGDGDEPLAVWCDKDNSGGIEADERTDDNRIWDFGTSSQYPAIRCTPISPTEWRSWWFLDEAGKPQLDRIRLDRMLPSFEDDDNDGVGNDSDDCPTGETGWTSNSSTDSDGDGCQDASEDTDDDNDGIGDNEGDACPVGETGWTSNSFTDNDRDGCQDASEDTDDDNDGLDDTDAREQQSGLGGVSCSLLVDCDGDSVLDEVDIDDDGDGLIEIATAAELDAVRYALNGRGRRLSAGADLNTTGCGVIGRIDTCSGYELVANISIAAYSDGKGWRPLGHDTDSSRAGCQGTAFDGTFEGNGWTISDLSINRSDEDCVGLFGRIAEGSKIRNLTLHADTVIGGRRVGGLVGTGRSARIHSSSVVVGEVRGTYGFVGGLIGHGLGSQLVSSSVVVGKVSGTGSIGGLIGWGESARIYSSSVVANEVIGSGHRVGGLVGWSYLARIHSSSVVVGEVEGPARVGGLVGHGADARIAYSYVVSGSDTAMLVGAGSGTGVASYWDSDTSGVSSGNHGQAKTSDELRSPAGYTGIYAAWNDDTDIFGDGEDVPLAVWCDKDNSGNITADERTDDNRVWDFGTSSQYPAIRCTPLSPIDWRSWWFLNRTGKPQLDRTRLDILLSSFEVDLTFAPISGGFRIGNQSDFGYFVSLNIRATSGGEVEERNINIAEFIDGSYDFTGLDDQSDWTFQIIGTLSDGREREVVIVFVWEENEESHNNGGIRPGLDTDGDRRADSVDDDDDNDGVGDSSDDCPTGETSWLSNGSTDNDGDGCQDANEDTDDDNDGLDDREDLCPAGETSWMSNSLTDNDGDGCRDADEDKDGGQNIDDDNDGHRNSVDVDDDGDGLIEIATAEELDAVRYALNGRGRRLSVGADLNTTGCGSDGGITSCSGYELVADISLAAYSDGEGWQPLGNDTDDRFSFGCRGVAFDGIFEGNGWTISDLSINRSSEDCVGLFGHIAEDSEIRNLTLRAEKVIGRRNVGGLVGLGDSVRIFSSSVVAGKVSGSGARVGGLVGWGDSARIFSSSVVAGKVSGSGDRIGGMVGRGDSVRIVSSSVVVDEISGSSGFVGGLVGQGNSARIHYSSVVVGEMSGVGLAIGGLVGDGESAQIVSSSVEVDKVSGRDAFSVGGLVGRGRSARIVSSSVVAAEVKGDGVIGNEVGGLVGDGWRSQIHSSSVVVGEVSGTDGNVGGLVGWGESARIHSSSVVATEVRGTGANVGGLVGYGESARIDSSSVVATEVRGTGTNVGGLVGYFEDGRVAYSYVVSGSDTAMLVGRGSGTGVASYWDSDVSGVSGGNHGEAKTSDELRMPTDYEGIYADWDEDTDIFGSEDEPLAVWCDKDNSGRIEADEKIDDNRLWDFGTSSQYPAIRCTPIRPAEWRSWWSLDEAGKPQLDRTRLDILLYSFEVDLTFAPISGGFRIGNQSDFGDLVSLNIRATSESGVVERTINIAEFIDGSYDFIGLDDRLDWTFWIIGTLSDGREREVVIVFVWEENEEDHQSGGIRPGINTDEDGRADSVDNDDDNDNILDLMDTGMVDGRECRLHEDCDSDGVADNSDQCRVGETGWTSNGSTDNDGDGCRDESEDADDDNDGLDDISDQCSIGETGWTSNSSTDNDGDGCRDTDEDTDDDNDGLDDREDLCPAGETGWTSNSLTDNDGDGCRDADEDEDGGQNIDDDNDGHRNDVDVDDDGDGLIEIATAAELDAVRYALDGRGRKLSSGAELDTIGCGGIGGITSCSGYELVADISLAAYANADGGKGWQPLGNADSSTDGCQGTSFAGAFEGNGWAISDLNINRSDEDCVGLFGNIAEDSEIRNLTLHAETVIGNRRVGGLVGGGRSARIISSSVVANEVRGTYGYVGGLIGDGFGSQLVSSSVVADKVSGTGSIGGLVGDGSSARIFSSSVVAAEVRGSESSVGGRLARGARVGGLVGWGNSAQIISSSVVVGAVRGSSNVGGLVGYGTDRNTKIISCSIVVGEVSGRSSVGGLVGDFDDGRVAYSYLVSGSNTDMLVGDGRGIGVASYWDSETSGVNSGNHGQAKTSDELRSPTGYEGIYAAWDDETDIFGDGNNEPLAAWCDKDHSGSIEAAERTDDNRVWDFGTSSDYPAIRCTPISPAEWRSWWFLDGAGQPQLNQTRLDILLSSFEVDLTFAPISGGFRIGNQSDFGDLVSLNIRATSESGVVERTINIAEFIDGSYDFIGLDDQLDWTFRIIGTLSDGREREVVIVFVWEENEEDHQSGGIRSGLDTDGDGRADSVDEDDDNDGLDDTDAREQQTNSNDVSCSLLADCDDDGIGDNEGDACPTGDTGWTSNGSTDNDGDGCRDESEDADDDNDGLDDTDAREQQSGLDGVSCSLLVDCDGDSVLDEADIDNDGDGLIELATAVELDAVRYALDGNGRRLAETASLDTTGCGGESGITSCSGYELVADISLAAYSDGKGWQPLGNDTSSEAGCQGAAFAGTFEGNGWTISDLNISRPDEDCVGLFGNIAEDSEIRNLTLHAERVIGNRRVGGLVGGGRSARIISSSAVVNEVRGTYGYVGGLIGDGFGSQLVSSSVVAGKVSGTGSIGGLVGFGPLARVVSSSVVANEVSGTSSRVGGLVGGGWESRIHSSSVVVGEVSGSYDVGSLVGDGDLARIHSSSVVAGEVSGAGRVGGLVGDFDDGRVAYSYLVSGSNTAVLVGRERGKTIGVASYWDSDVSGVSSGNNGDPKTTNELRSPTGYEEIYAAWDDETDIFGDGDEPLAVWCDEDHSGSIEADERTDDNRVWNFGTSGEYPAIRCTPISPAEWRGWWFLDGAGQPQLNQTRLDELLP